MPYLIFEHAAGLLRLQIGRCNGCGEGASAALRQQTAPYGTRKYLLRLLSPLAYRACITGRICMSCMSSQECAC